MFICLVKLLILVSHIIGKPPSLLLQLFMMGTITGNITLNYIIRLNGQPSGTGHHAKAAVCRRFEFGSLFDKYYNMCDSLMLVLSYK